MAQTWGKSKFWHLITINSLVIAARALKLLGLIYVLGGYKIVIRDQTLVAH